MAYLEYIENPTELPVCAVCRKPIDRVTSYHDVLRQRWVYVFVCHGDVEIVRLTREEVVAARSIALRECFATPRLGSG